MASWVEEERSALFGSIDDASIAEFCLSDGGFGREQQCRLVFSERREMFGNVCAHFLRVFASKLP